ncbi:YciI family protein [Nocardia sp. NPDC050378]|uniref:YciI family protein n=1 Tax=Nocardia TaxID=1817 RepID=UPI001CD9FD0F|nr:YciI family protein [Nocardia rosealba]MCA2208492.1 YciI family protein [Nocardia rosealba]
MAKYLVMARRTPGFDASVIEPHREFLRDLLAKGQLQESGGFSDGTGGAYVVLAENLDAATTIVHSDPLHTMGASELTIHEWTITVSA